MRLSSFHRSTCPLSKGVGVALPQRGDCSPPLVLYQNPTSTGYLPVSQKAILPTVKFRPLKRSDPCQNFNLVLIILKLTMTWNCIHLWAMRKRSGWPFPQSRHVLATADRWLQLESGGARYVNLNTCFCWDTFITLIYIDPKITEVQMGALLEGVEALNNPVGIIILVIVVAAAYLWYRWLFSEPKEPESK